MPEEKKKIMVKVAKKANVEAEEAKKGVYDKETTADAKSEGYVPKGLTKELIAKVNETTAFNKKRTDTESMAKNDSIVGAKKASMAGKDIIDQRRAGNKAANETRAKGKIPQVTQGREISNTNYPAPDKYTNPMDRTGSGTSDVFTRTAPLEKDMPLVVKNDLSRDKKTFVKVKKK